MSIYSTALTGLNASQLALQTVAHNIANVNTAGYTRQYVGFATNTANRVGAGYVGQGVNVDQIGSYSNKFLEQTLTSAITQSGRDTKLQSLTGSISDLVSGSSTSIAPALNDMAAALSSIEQNPLDMAARQVFLGKANGLAAQFRTMGAQLASQRQQVNDALSQDADKANSLATQIADINQKIKLAEATVGTGSASANDLRDQRQQAINELAKLGSVTTVDTAEGVNVFFGGAGLVIGSTAGQLKAVASPTDPQTMVISIQSPGIPAPTYLKDASMGGEIGALASFRDGLLAQTQASLDQMASLVSQKVNSLLSTGMDLDGNAGAALFRTTGGTVTASSLNTGSAQVTVSNIDATQTYPGNVVARWDGAQWNFSRAPDASAGPAIPASATMPVTIDGMTVDLSSGTPNAGDVFTIKPSDGAAINLAVNPITDRQLGMAAPVMGSAGASNSGQVKMTGLTANEGPADPNLKQDVTITFNGDGTYNISGTGTGNLTNVPFANNEITANGWTMKFEGAPGAGDTFTVTAGKAPSSDATVANALSDAFTSAQVSTSQKASFADLFGKISAKAGSEAQLAKSAASASAGYLDAAQANRDSYSGVNLDEEGASLVQYQQAYAAAGKAISIAQDLFQQIINIMN